MSIISFFKNLFTKGETAKKEANSTPQFVGKPKKVYGKPRPKTYIATCDMVYNGKAIRQFDVTELGYSRDVVAKKIEDNFEIKVVKINVK